MLRWISKGWKFLLPGQKPEPEPVPMYEIDDELVLFDEEFMDPDEGPKPTTLGDLIKAQMENDR